MVACPSRHTIYSCEHTILSVRADDIFGRTYCRVYMGKQYIRADILPCTRGQTIYSHGHTTMSVWTNDIFLRTFCCVRMDTILCFFNKTPIKFVLFLKLVLPLLFYCQRRFFFVFYNYKFLV